MDLIKVNFFDQYGRLSNFMKIWGEEPDKTFIDVTLYKQLAIGLGEDHLQIWSLTDGKVWCKIPIKKPTNKEQYN